VSVSVWIHGAESDPKIQNESTSKAQSGQGAESNRRVTSFR
jgi:hypothetical protein